MYASVPEGYAWFGSATIEMRSKRLEVAYNAIKEGLTELLPDRGFDKKSRLSDFVVMITRQWDRSFYRGLKENPAKERFSYAMNDRISRREDDALVVQIYGEHATLPNDFLKWRAKNAFAKIIGTALQPNDASLEAYLIYNSEHTVPKSQEDHFFLHGSKQCKREYMALVPETLWHVRREE